MNESERIKALKEYGILDSVPEKEFNEIIELASAMFDMPISFISLIESERQWFKAIKGLSVTEAERKYAFCNHTIDHPERVMIINDATKDPRFQDNPYVVDNPEIRFYAGVALVTENNHAIGTMCVIDNKTREFTEKDAELLKTIAHRVMVLLDARKETIRNQRELSLTKEELDLTLYRLIEAQSIARIGSWDWDIKNDVLYWSPEMYNIYGISSEEENLFDKWMSMVHPDDLDLVRSTILGGLKHMRNASFEHRIVHNSGEEFWIEIIGTVRVDKGEVIRMSGTVQDVTKRKNAEIKQSVYLKTLKDMMFDLSHKLRQPLTNSIGLVDAFSSFDLSDENTRELIEFLKISIHKMDEYVREMSDAIFSSKEEIGK